MAIKDWKKDEQTKNSIIYRKGHKYLDIVKRNGFWCVDNPEAKTIAKTTSKARALKYAKSYMRKH